MINLNTYLNKLIEYKILKKSDLKRGLFLSTRQLNYFLKTGKPIPDNFLYLIKKNFTFSPEEFEKILESYEISMYGEQIAFNKKSIHKLIKQFHGFYNQSILDKRKASTFQNFILPTDLIEFLDNLFSNAIKPADKIRLFTLQGEAVSELGKYIISKLYSYKNRDMEIEHIFQYKNLKDQPDMGHNLTFLSSITSLIASYENYNPYFYTVSYTQENSYTIYPNSMLIFNTLIYISEDFKTWFYIDRNKEQNIYKIVSLYNTEFEKSKGNTKPFIRTMKDMASFQEFITHIESTSAIERELRRDMPCLAPPPKMSIDWFEYDKNVISEEILKELAELHNIRTANFEKRLNEGFKMSIVCSRNSTSDFLNTGRIYDQGEYPTFNINARIIMMSNLIKQLSNPSFDLHFIREDMIQYFPFIDKVQLCTNDDNVMISITNDNSEICKHQPFVFAVLLDSPEISSCFNQYIDTIIKTATYSKSESISIIKNDLDNFLLKNDIKI